MTFKLIGDCLRMLPLCMLVAVFATLAGYRISSFIRSRGCRRKTLALCTLLSLYFVPSLALSFFWSGISFTLMRHAFLNEFFYGLLIGFRLLPVAVMIFHFVPQTISAQGTFCMGLVGGGGRLRWLAFLARSSGKPFAASVLLCFLLAFSEFELASLLNVRHWTVSLFDLNAGGCLSFAEVLRLIAFPVLLELSLIIAFVFCYRDEEWLRRPEASEIETKVGRHAGVQSFAIAACGLLALLFCPFAGLLAKGANGLPSVLCDEGFMRDSLAGVIFAFLSTLLAFYVSGILLKKLSCPAPGVTTYASLSFFLVPGLVGALPLGLVLLQLFQLPGLLVMRDTPVPLTLALFLYQLPFAFFLRYAFSALAPDESLFLAKRMLLCRTSREAGGRILWRLQHLVNCCVFIVIFMPAYFEITLPTILAPVTMPTSFMKLYNLMHYGYSEKLAGVILLAVLLPVLLFLILLALSRATVPLRGLSEEPQRAN